MDCRQLFFKIFDLKYWLRKWLGIDITLSPDITLSIKDGKFIIQNKGEITAKNIALKFDVSFKNTVRYELDKQKCEMLNISSVAFQEVPQVRELFAYKKRLHKTAIEYSSLNQKIYIHERTNIDDAVTQLKKYKQEKYNEYTKLKQKVDDLKNFLIGGKILKKECCDYWEEAFTRYSKEGIPVKIQSESQRYFCIEKEIDDFYDNVEKEPIRTLSKEQQHDFNIPEPLIKIIGKTKHQWICNVHYFYENGPKKGKEGSTTISVSPSIPPKSPPPLPNR